MSKKFSLNKIYVFIVLLVSFSLCVMCANLMSSFITIGTFSFSNGGIKQNSFDVYALCLASSNSLTQANELGKNYRDVNAGGFVWEKEGVYYVLASCYLSESDAKKVNDNLSKSYSSSIIKLSFDEVAISGNFNQQEKITLSNSLALFKSIYQRLYDISISLDTSVSNEIDCKIEIGNTKSNAIKIKSEFDSVFAEKATNSLVMLKIKLEEIINILEELSSKELELSSELKYSYLKVLNVYNSLIEEISVKM